MDNWKSQLDARLEARKAVQEQERRKRLEREITDRKLREESAAAGGLLEHQNRFRCYICGRASQGPKQKVEYYMDGLGQEAHTRSISRDVWEIPTGLERCSRCKKWTCDEHLHRGYCMNDAKNV